MIKSLVVFYSLGGNTEAAAMKITKKLSSLGQEFNVLALRGSVDYKTIDIEGYDIVFIGSPTYKKGNTPKPVLDYLRYLLKYNNFSLPPFSVFGTGDTQWGDILYSRAVDEIAFHITKKTKVINTIKIEQRPTSKKQINKIYNYVEESLRRI